MSLPALPLFHRIAGQPVIVLGHGDAAQAKRRLVERAGGQVVEDLAHGIDIGARLAFIAHDNADACMADALRARGAGLLVNVVDRPALCDFTTPSLIDRSPVVVAVGTAGASAGLAKHVRLRLERLLPQGLGPLAEALFAVRDALRARFPDGADRRRALDVALGEGGALDPMVEQPAGAVEAWLNGARAGQTGHHVIALRSADPEDLTLREARLLGMADAVIADAAVPPALLARARADAQRLPPGAMPPDGLTVELRF
jgi:uroporphyrin-III C-methyltransferase/precorrin-2 dehydrogenase/sirohydrochlorin ferrochelatase